MNSLALLQTQIFTRSSELGWTHTELARRAGVARETVSRLKQRQDADFSLLAKLCKALGLQIEAQAAQPLTLSFPYNWSNPAMSFDAIIAAILERGLFEDVLEAVRYWGLQRVQAVSQKHATTSQVARMLRNIEVGFSKA
jgi:DNA-binding Xre family transcriptional regulator